MKIKVNINKKRFFILLATMFVIGGGLFAYAYTTDGSGNPAIMGHSADEVEGAGFGQFMEIIGTQKSSINLAETDGFLIVKAYLACCGNYVSISEGETDTSLVQVAKMFVLDSRGRSAHENTVTIPISKGNYWKIESNIGFTAFWKPIN
mgnify:FL=1